MRRIEHTGQFKRETKGQHRATLDDDLMPVVKALACDQPLESRHGDHALTGGWKNHRNCHVRPDPVLIYRKPDDEALQLVRIGSQRAVDAIDELRGEFNDGESGSPPQLRDDLLKLHQLAMAVINQGSRSQVADLFDLALDLEDQVLGMMTTLERVQDTLSQLTVLHPESLSYGGLDDVETD